MRSRRLLAALSAAAVTLGLGLATAAPAAALPSDLKILVFANNLVSDVDEEVTLEMAALAGLGATIDTFDGGDGSGAAWAAALNGYDILLLPEMEIEGTYFFEAGGGLLSVDAATTIKGWVEAGGWVFFHGTYDGFPNDYGYFVSYITGVDYDSVFQFKDIGGAFDLQQPVPDAPMQLEWVDGTYVLEYGSWSPELQSGVAPLYLDASDNMAMGVFDSQGAGSLFLVSYDWYPDNEVDPQLILDWGSALSAAMAMQEPGGYPAVAPPPQLAATGSGDLAVPVLALGALLLLAGGVVLAARRRVA